MSRSNNADEPVQPRLGLWDGVSIVVGIVVGVGIFKTPSMVFSNVSDPWQGLGAWALGGLLAVVGALCYAELATTYPRSGGDYVYLTRAYGAGVGFLFGWAQLAVILTGSIGTMAYAFSDYAVALWVADESQTAEAAIQLRQRWGVWLAVIPVVTLTVVNLFGVILGKATQNVLTGAKVLGLAGIILAALFWGGSGSLASIAPSGPGFGLAMVFVLYTYGGWNDAAFVAADVRDPRRNIPRVLLIGTGGVMVIYLLVNTAYVWGLGFDGVRSSSAPAADLIQRALGDWSSKIMSLLVMISVLGAVNGMIFTGSRIYSSLGSDHRIFTILGRWHPKLGVPVWSMVTQAAIALFLIGAVGTEIGRNLFDSALQSVRLSPLPWKEYGGGFDTLLAGTAPIFWLFFLLTGISLFVLRIKDRDVERSFTVPLYPLLPGVFCLMCIYMIYSSLTYAKGLSLLGIVPLLLGLVLYFFSRLIAAGH